MKPWGIGLVFLLAGASSLPERPTVVSIDSCSDQLVLALADDAQILSLSQDSKGVFSYYRDRAFEFPQHTGTAEEIFLLEPDLIVATGAGDAALAETLKRLGYRVVSFDLPPDISGALQSLEAAGKALGQTDKANALRAQAEAGLENLQNSALSKPGFYVSPSGVTTGSGTFLDEVLTLGGIENQLAGKGVTGWSQFDLETILTLKAEVVVTSFFDNTEGAANSWRFSSHPVMKEAMARVKVIDVPSRYLSCPAWFAVEGAALIRKEILGEDE